MPMIKCSCLNHLSWCETSDTNTGQLHLGSMIWTGANSPFVTLKPIVCTTQLSLRFIFQGSCTFCVLSSMCSVQVSSRIAGGLTNISGEQKIYLFEMIKSARNSWRIVYVVHGVCQDSFWNVLSLLSSPIFFSRCRPASVYESSHVFS